MKTADQPRDRQGRFVAYRAAAPAGTLTAPPTNAAQELFEAQVSTGGREIVIKRGVVDASAFRGLILHVSGPAEVTIGDGNLAIGASGSTLKATRGARAVATSGCHVEASAGSLTEAFEGSSVDMGQGAVVFADEKASITASCEDPYIYSMPEQMEAEL